MPRPSLLTLILAVLMFTNCGGCKKGGGSEDYDVPDGQLGEVLKTMCGVLDRCPDAFGSPIAYRSKKECAAILNFVLTCRITEEELGDDVTKYGVERQNPEVDGDNVDACKAWLADASCEEIARGGSTPCETVLSLNYDDDDDWDPTPVGTAGVDENCEQTDDCAPELFCTGGGSDSALGITYCQVCRERAEEGEDCSQTPCTPGFWCKGPADGSTPGVCAPPEADGFRCYSDDQCLSEYCNQSLDDGGGWGMCDPGGSAGDPCADEYSDEGIQPTCREGLACEDGTCETRRANGQPCSDSYSCETGSCHEATKICGAPDGEPCSWDGECAAEACVNDTCGLSDGECFLDADCGAGEVCAGACQPPNCECSGCPVGECTPSGQAGCQDDSDCGTGDCVDGNCTSGPKVGDACSDEFSCYPYQCVNGACAAKAAPGQSCTSIDSCQEPFLCIEGTCQIMNLTCAPARAGERCAWLRVCDDSSWCDLLDNVTCKAKAKLGNVCQTTFLRGVETCMPGSTCAYDEASGEQRCVALPKVGEACTAKCADGACWGGTCRAAPIGTPCDYDTPCPTGLRCEDDREICVPPGQAGEPCQDFEDCADGLFCENYDTCEPRKSQGTDCRDTQECASDLWCPSDSYTCEPRLQNGAECRSNDYACAEGFFCPSGISVCEPARPPGAQCYDNSECLSGACYSSNFCLADSECVLPE